MMKFFSLTGALILISLTAVAAPGKSVIRQNTRGMGLSVVGLWALQGRTCHLPDGASFGQKLLNKLTRQNRMSYRDELLVLGADGAVRTFGNDGELLTEGEFATANNASVTLRYRGIADSKLTVKLLTKSQMTLSYKNDPNCSGTVSENYSRVNLFPSYDRVD